MNRLTRATLAAAGTTAIGAAAVVVGGGAATQDPVPAPVVLATEDAAQEDLIARVVADMTRDEDPEDWDRRYGDGT